MESLVFPMLTLPFFETILLCGFSIEKNLFSFNSLRNKSPRPGLDDSDEPPFGKLQMRDVKAKQKKRKNYFNLESRWFITTPSSSCFTFSPRQGSSSWKVKYFFSFPIHSFSTSFKQQMVTYILLSFPFCLLLTT